MSNNSKVDESGHKTIVIKKRSDQYMSIGAPGENRSKKVAVIVAHPDDETLWAGGTILDNPLWKCIIVTLCRRDDADRAPKFAKVLQALGAEGIMGDMDDGPDQIPLPDEDVQDSILRLVPETRFDLVITHSIYGEYTRHRRHEEIGRAVIQLWHTGKLDIGELWAFAYDDQKRTRYPEPLVNATIHNVLLKQVWDRKYNIITQIYGFNSDSWEAQATPREEAFWRFLNHEDAWQWLLKDNLMS